jgi:hypothetical protein
MINLIHFGGLGGHQTDYLNYFQLILRSRFKLNVTLISEKLSSSVVYDQFIRVKSYSYFSNIWECLKICCRLNSRGSTYFFSNSNDNLILIFICYFFISKKIVLFELFPLVEGVGLLRRVERILLYKFCEFFDVQILTNVPISRILYKSRRHVFIGDPCLDIYFKDSFLSRQPKPKCNEPINVLVFGAIDDRKNIEYLLKITSAARRDNLVSITVAGKIFSDSVAEVLKNESGVRIISHYLSTAEVKNLFFSTHCLWVNYKRFIYASGVLGLSCIYKRPVIYQNYGIIGSLCNEIVVGLSIDSLLSDGYLSYIKLLEMLDMNCDFAAMLSRIHKDEFDRNEVITHIFNHLSY